VYSTQQQSKARRERKAEMDNDALNITTDLDKGDLYRGAARDQTRHGDKALQTEGGLARNDQEERSYVIEES
jgi:hypothetical protein